LGLTLDFLIRRALSEWLNELFLYTADTLSESFDVSTELIELLPKLLREPVLEGFDVLVNSVVDVP